MSVKRKAEPPVGTNCTDLQYLDKKGGEAMMKVFNEVWCLSASNSSFHDSINIINYSIYSCTHV